MKRFLLFAGATYYPGGGWDDFIDSFDSINEARIAGQEKQKDGWDWFQIVDTETMKDINE